MKKYQKEIIWESTFELIKTIFDIVTPFFEASSIYRMPARKYRSNRGADRDRFWQRIGYLKQRGLIDIYVEGKERYYEISPKGKIIMQKYSYKNIEIIRSKTWDGKWRVIIFDIPEKLRASRDVLREKLYQLQFFQIQKSVYVYPFECSGEIKYLSEHLLVSKCVLIMISEIIQGEGNIIEFFLKRGVLSDSDIKKNDKL